MFQLIQPERILYMQAKNSVEELEWYCCIPLTFLSNQVDCRLTALSKSCMQSSCGTLYHSGAYTNAAWSWLVHAQM